MTLPNVKRFVEWALYRAKKNTIPLNAELAVPIADVGKEGEWEYLFGTTGTICTKALIEERWTNYYSKHNWTRASYDNATKNHVGKYVCDCNGLLDKYRGEDMNAQYTYANYCTDKGEISKIDRPYVIGEAVFRYSNDSKKMVHIGWICGFSNGNEPLVVEERDLNHGCVISKLQLRNFTHRGLMTKIFSYEDEQETPPEVGWLKTPEAVKALQTALNLNGYTDYEGKLLEVDGKWGKRSKSALEKMLDDRRPTILKSVKLTVENEVVYEGAV